MTMNILEYIAERPEVREMIHEMQLDPIKQIMERDDLPCDCIVTIDGQPQKAVEISDDRYVSIYDLLSYSREDVDKLDDVEFKAAYYSYMEQIIEEKVDIDSIMSSIRDYKANLARKKELLQCTN